MSMTMALLLGTVCAGGVRDGSEIRIIPEPVKVEAGRGTFRLNEETRILCEPWNDGATKAAKYLATVLCPATGYPLPVETASESREVDRVDCVGGVDNAILLVIVSGEEGLGREGYRLRVTRKGVVISAPHGAGLFYGVQTLRQLLPTDVFSPTRVERKKWTVPCVEIEDFPRFAWRGMLLDVARHFMPKEFLKEFIDALALHKMNSLQLHLTDDQGWRVEIKKYPRLTEVGAWRKETVVGHARHTPWKFDGKPHGGFYTQDDIRELVAYAAERHVRLVPEIEMPGHAQAAIAAYPELGNTGEELPVWTGWGVNENIFNADKKTILFLQDVLEEVVALFPGQYIHIGGDEAVKGQWEQSEAVQARIKELGLNDEREMQAYFIGRMNDFLAERGRRLIGWDEILEGA